MKFWGLWSLCLTVLPNINSLGGVSSRSNCFPTYFTTFTLKKKKLWPFEKCKHSISIIELSLFWLLVKLNVFHIFWQIEFLFFVFVLFKHLCFCYFSHSFPLEIYKSSLYFKDLNTLFDKHDEYIFQFIPCFLILIFWDRAETLRNAVLIMVLSYCLG